MNNITLHTFIPNHSKNNIAGAALKEIIATQEPVASWSKMMLYRIDGNASKYCTDQYYIAIQDEKCVSRLWCGWGNHKDAIGNWGNFKTADCMQGKGIGRRLLDFWFDHMKSISNEPLAFLCTCGKPNLVKLYSQYGFRPALKNRETGPLYCPLGNSPESFQDFCEMYYSNSNNLKFLPGNIQHRHEIDCLLSFSLQEYGKSLGLPSIGSYEEAILLLKNDPQAGLLERIVIDNGHTVGWAFTPIGGAREMQIHPKYQYMI